MKTHALALAASLVFCVSSAIADDHADGAGWWNDAVFYEIFVRSFADSIEGPLANDGVGDLRGMTARLDYLNDGNERTEHDLGINAIWLMPIAQSPSYHGYDVTDYASIDDEYGTPKDFRAFVDACHERGIRVIVDLVLNHTSGDHPWFEAAASDQADPKRDWYVWSDEDPGYAGPWGQQVWHDHALAASGQYFYGCFWHGMPDLNLRNAAVTRELKKVARFWIEDMDVDGFRLDAIKHLIEDGAVQENTQATIDWLEDFQAYCKSLDPDFFSVGEVWSSTDEVARYIPGAVDTAFEFDLSSAIINGLNDGDAHLIRHRLWVIDNAYETPVATFLTNHDQSRLMSQLNGDEDAARAAASILLTLPGIPFLYYGEEIGHVGAKPDPNIRTPMQWDADGSGFSSVTAWRAAQDNAAQVNVGDQFWDSSSLLHHYRTLIDLRHEHEVLRSGDLVILDTEEDSVLAFIRRGEGGEQLLVIVNTSSEPIGWAAVPLDRAVGRGSVREVSGNTRPFGSLNEARDVFRSGGLRGHELFVLELPAAK